MGKTSLLDELVTAAGEMQVLRARPLQAEMELSFAGLADLFRNCIDLVDQLPAPQAAALLGALALGPPVPGDRFVVAAATLTLLSVAAERGPLLAVIDDAQWLDEPSREAVCFAGRRLAREGILLVLGARDEGWITSCGLSTLVVEGLGPPDAAALLEQAAPGTHRTVQSRLIDETAGNPLGLLEAVAMLSPDQLAGMVPITGPLPVGDGLERALGRPVLMLPARTRQALLISSAADNSSTAAILAALTQAGLELADLERGEQAGIITISDGNIKFRHPLVRAATYHLHSGADRRSAHRALAEVAVAGGDLERAAWQLASAVTGPDETVAQLLETAGSTAAERNAYATAARAFETSASLSLDPDDRLRRATHAGRALWRSGDSRKAETLLSDVVGLARDPITRADLQALRAGLSLVNRPVAETHALLVEEAGQIEAIDPTRAATMLAQASLTGYFAGNAAQALTLAQRGVFVAGEGPAATLANLALGLAQTLTGDIAAATVRLSSAQQLVDQLDLAQSELTMLIVAVAIALVWIDRDEGYTILEHVVAADRAASSLAALSFSLATLALAHLKQGQIRAAYADASEALDLAQEAGEPVSLTYTLTTLAQAEAVLGYDDDCRRHVASALELGDQAGVNAVRMVAPAALGLLELSLGHPERAVPHLLAAATTKMSIGAQLPTDILPDLVEAFALSGETAQAARWRSVLERLVKRTDLRSGHAVAARLRGLLAGETDYEDHFAVAISHHRSKEPFELARTQLCLGMRRRRSRRRADAREVLRQALSYFEASGAQPWANRAEAELRATGGQPPRKTITSLRPLTSQELQVAMSVARGATNKEVANALFLSVKTVEFHLANIYRKLSVRSRTELAHQIATLP
jgi:DNA-binding CsgD family transcriptional regulator